MLGTRLPRHKGVLGFLSYFLFIGAGYILIEVGLIQKFVLFLGSPTYALAVVIFSMLIWTGAGSFASKGLIGRDEGRLLPEGLKYIDSWVEPNFSRCFQLMECDDARLLQEWALRLRGSGVSLEFVPVVTSKDTQAVVAPHLDKA